MRQDLPGDMELILFRGGYVYKYKGGAIPVVEQGGDFSSLEEIIEDLERRGYDVREHRK